MQVGGQCRQRSFQSGQGVGPGQQLQVLASPPASNMLSRVIYLADHIPTRVDVVDEGAASND